MSKTRKNKHRPRPAGARHGASVVWDGPNLLDRLAQLGPGICTVEHTARRPPTPMVFDVQADGRFGAEPETQDLLLRARFYRLAGEYETLGVVMRTFLRHRLVDIPRGDDPSRTVRVPVKELRGYVVKSQEREGQIILRYTPIPVDELKQSSSIDLRVGGAVKIPLSADHIFVQDLS